MCPGYQEVLEPSHFLSWPMMDNLLESVRMLVPFWDNFENRLGLHHTLQTTAVQERLGGFHNSWTAFQLELAVDETIFLGGPCVVLPGSIHHHSSSWQSINGKKVTQIFSYKLKSNALLTINLIKKNIIT